MSRKPALAIFNIVSGLLLVAAGLGYTVNQASLYTALSNENAAVPLEEQTVLPEMDGHPPSLHSLPRPSSLDTELRKVLEGSELGKMDETDFFFPALSLLSGAILASIGAIALVHRYRGI